MEKEKIDILELFLNEKTDGTFLKIGAPMVRYSRLEFRQLLRKYNTKLCFTPMIVAESFCQSQKARDNEFTTNINDSPLIAQFAAKNSNELQIASQLIYPYVDGIDLNCGCPQSWAIAKGYGCALLKNPQLLQDMISSVRQILPNKFSCSVKMRILQKSDLKTTVDLCRKLEHCGATFITIHARTPWQKTSEPVDIDAITQIKQSIKIPLVYNGDVKTLDDANKIHIRTNCDGIMAARGLLTNPTLFDGTNQTTVDCVQDWINIAAAADSRITFQCFHHHLTFMLEKLIQRKIRTKFNNFNQKEQVFDFLKEHQNIEVDKTMKVFQNYENNLICKYNTNSDYIIENYSNKIKNDWNENENGKFFKSFNNVTTCEDNDYDEDQFSFMGTSIFDSE